MNYFNYYVVINQDLLFISTNKLENNFALHLERQNSTPNKNKCFNEQTYCIPMFK